MNKEIPIVRFEFGGEEAFAQTHTDGVIGLEDLIEQIVIQYLRSDTIITAPTGQRFKLTVNDAGVLGTERVEG